MSERPLAWSPLGDRALLVSLGDRVDPALNARVIALSRAFRDARPGAVTDIVPAYAAIGVWFDPEQRTYEDLVEELAGIAAQPIEPARFEDRPEHVIPTRYDGPDLARVAERASLTEAEVVTRHASGRYRVFLLGFVPGFAFLGPLDPALILPRRDQPRTRVPAGSVAIAGAQTAVYPLATPGGWHLIGKTEVRFFDPRRDPPALLEVGDRVRFEPIG